MQIKGERRETNPISGQKETFLKPFRYCDIILCGGSSKKNGKLFRGSFCRLKSRTLQQSLFKISASRKQTDRKTNFVFHKTLRSYEESCRIGVNSNVVYQLEEVAAIAFDYQHIGAHLAKKSVFRSHVKEKL